MPRRGITPTNDDEPSGRIRLKDVAAAAGLSTATVSRVLNGTAPVSVATALRVREAAARLGFVVNRLAQGLARGRTRTVGVLIANIESPFYHAALRGIETVLAISGYTVVLCNSNRDAALEERFVDDLEEEQAAGLVVTTGGELDARLAQLANRGIPSVLLTRKAGVSDIRIHSVRLDNEAAGVLATEHLIALGHERIAIVVGPQRLATQRDRLAGYRAALVAHDLPYSPALIRVCDNSLADKATEVVTSLLTRKPRPDAVFAANSMFALGAYRAARRLGLRIPEDVAILGFDDFEWAAFVDPPLSTVVQPALEMGQTAAKILVEELVRPGDVARERVFQPAIAVRSSCGSRPT